MGVSAMEIVEIEWHPRLLVDIAEGDWEYSISRIPEACRNKSSFYCMYGRHPVYGPDVLLYIGESKIGTSARDILVRIKEHLGGRFWNQVDLSISIGIPRRPVTDADMKLVESILIAAHVPALNRKHIDGAMRGSEHILVQNTGFIRSLITECSGNYWVE